MRKFEYPQLGETLYKEQLSNGLTVVVLPRPGFSRKLAYFATDFGSIHTDFSLEGREIHAPAGIAHFLEHHDDFDMAIMGDVCGYINNIEYIIALLKNKKIVLTIETTTQDNVSTGPSGRYRHNPEYIEKLLRENGFKVIFKEDIVLRKEAGEDVKGIIFRGE